MLSSPEELQEMMVLRAVSVIRKFKRASVDDIRIVLAALYQTIVNDTAKPMELHCRHGGLWLTECANSFESYPKQLSELLDELVDRGVLYFQYYRNPGYSPSVLFNKRLFELEARYYDSRPAAKTAA